MEKVLQLSLVMDQGFACIYQVNQSSFVGIVQLKNQENQVGNTLISFNSKNLQKDFKRIQKHQVINLTKVKPIQSINLHSFFFEDKEGHRFEIQRFDDPHTRQLFES
jgi:hypothetical protein